MIQAKLTCVNMSVLPASAAIITSTVDHQTITLHISAGGAEIAHVTISCGRVQVLPSFWQQMVPYILKTVAEVNQRVESPQASEIFQQLPPM